MTVTVRLPDELEAKLRARLAQDDVALSEYVRQAIAEKLEREPVGPKKTAYEIWQECFAGESGGSGESDRSQRTGDIMRAKLNAKRRRRQ